MTLSQAALAAGPDATEEEVRKRLLADIRERAKDSDHEFISSIGDLSQPSLKEYLAMFLKKKQEHDERRRRRLDTLGTGFQLKQQQRISARSRRRTPQKHEAGCSTLQELRGDRQRFCVGSFSAPYTGVVSESVWSLTNGVPYSSIQFLIHTKMYDSDTF